MPTPAPKSCPRENGLSTDWLNELSSDWTKAFRATRTHRTRRLLLPLTWMLVLCTIFPFGMPRSFDTSGFAQSANRSKSASKRSSRKAPHAPRATRMAAVAIPTSLEKASDANSPTAAAASATTDAASATTDATTKGVATTVPAAPLAAPSITAPAAPNTTTPAPALPSAVPEIAPINRSVSVRAIISGKKRQVTLALTNENTTVGEVLRAMKITLHPLDRVQPLAERIAWDGMTIRVTRIRADLKTRIKLVPYETFYKPTAELERGTKRTIQEGRAGAIEVVERVWSRDGRVTMREFVSQSVDIAPQPQIVGLGARSHYLPNRIPYHNRYARAYALSSRGGSPRDRLMRQQSASPIAGTLRAVRSISLVATGYSPDPSENGGYTTTATGLPIGYGAAAVDPRVIPLGTLLFVEGYGYAFACDTGGAIKGHRIDLAYDSYRVANSKGHKRVRVWILSK